ncbi:hypothetical protein MUU72_05635 [Streptomyces sp. RS10V-4]|uniref:hypothetical protein n=1 Tax=Streptomyces rhizoryzae TaxID=2932493 RepID=UPI00200525DA|nr:hypothetical protein [Streptomyces rhizoryzae]MCK7622592.1 hypothetical protein [Streptomyces rhizoryzae]
MSRPGLAALVVAVCCGCPARPAHTRARAMAGTETLPAGDIRAGHEAAAAAAGRAARR